MKDQYLANLNACTSRVICARLSPINTFDQLEHLQVHCQSSEAENISQ